MNNKLERLLDKAYAPYSKYHVAAITVWNDGSEYKGINVENCAYPSGICAERSSIFTAVTDGKRILDEVHIMIDNERYPSPCGGCRQVIAEFAHKDTKIFAYRKGVKAAKVYNFFRDILPDAFTPKDLLGE